jgi:hypothetical protein
VECPPRIDSGGIPFAAFPHSLFHPCPECGASVERAKAAEHVCDEERRLEFRLRCEIADFDAQLGAWLTSPEGGFAAWMAERLRP